MSTSPFKIRDLQDRVLVLGGEVCPDRNASLGVVGENSAPTKSEYSTQQKIWAPLGEQSNPFGVRSLLLPCSFSAFITAGIATLQL